MLELKQTFATFYTWIIESEDSKSRVFFAAIYDFIVTNHIKMANIALLKELLL